VKKLAKDNHYSREISRLEKGERIADIYRNVRYAHASICKICDNTAGITENAKLGTKVFV
jgi:hypothetical protein